LLKVVIFKCQLTLSNIQASMWIGPAALAHTQSSPHTSHED